MLNKRNTTASGRGYAPSLSDTFNRHRQARSLPVRPRERTVHPERTGSLQTLISQRLGFTHFQAGEDVN